ncbi:hypothetical protein ACHAPJ_002459 [Fusarium lateritium]
MASENLRPVFIYGTLLSSRILSQVLTGDCRNICNVDDLSRLGRIYGYKQCAIDDGASSTLIEDNDPSSVIHGLLLTLENSEQRQRLDNYGAGDYEAVSVSVFLDNDEEVDADMYIWAQEENELNLDPWDWDQFINEYIAPFGVDELYITI